MTKQDEPDEGNKALESALAAYKDAWYAGERIDIEAYCHDHPACGEELREAVEDFLFVVEQLPYAHRGAKDDAAAGRVLGDFRILREIGRGGMGTVYEAEQISLDRKVALKILPAHLSFSKGAVLKFRREAAAGGRQSHPGIVSVFAVGEHKGVHYIAQELLEGGRTMADLLDGLRKEDEIPQGYFQKAAQLVRRVAEALQHAHDARVIHRDVKPTNILLTRDDMPKVTDFGLAKVEDALSLSRTGDFSGTPYYMSPEQISKRRIKLDHRTDIYSLGVTLYEMLTLRRPFEGKTSHDVFKKILVHEPRDPRRVNLRVPRDLAMICLKAMEKDPGRRYPSMKELGEDLGRYLAGEVVLARPASFQTRTYKWTRRHPVVSVSTGILFFSVIAFLGYVLLWSYPQIIEERDRAVQAQKLAEAEKERALAAEEAATRAREETETERERADAGAKKAKSEAQTTKTVLDFLVGLFNATDPAKARGAEITAKEILDLGVEKIRKEFDDRPEIKARLLSTMGNVYISLGRFDDAEPLLERALELRRTNDESGHLELDASKNDLAQLYKTQGRYEEAELLFHEGLEGLRETLGEDHHNTLIAKANLAELYHHQGKYKKAETLFLETLERFRSTLGEEHELTLNAVNSLSINYLDQGRFEEAKVLLSETVDSFRRVLGDDHPTTFVMLSNLANAYHELGQFEEAENLYGEALTGLRLILGNDHPQTLTVIQCMGCLHLLSGRLEEAEPLLREALKGLRKVLGSDHQSTTITMNALAVLYNDQGRYQEAEPLYLENLECVQKAVGADHPSTLTSMINLATFYRGQGRQGEAEKLFVEAIEGYRRVQPQHPHAITGMTGLADLYLGQERFEEAEELYIEALEGRRRIFGNEHPDTLALVARLGGHYMKCKKNEEAAPLCREAYEGLRDLLGMDHPSTQVALYHLVIVTGRRGQHEEARALAEILVEHTPKDHPDFEHHKDLLGQIRKKIEEIGSNSSGLPED